MRTRARLCLLLALLAAPLAAQEDAVAFDDLPELGSPDWLSDAITRPHANVATDASVAQITVLPLDAVDGAIPLAGPRSIVADFEHWTMVSAFPRDRYGNSVADGTETICPRTV